MRKIFIFFGVLLVVGYVFSFFLWVEQVESVSQIFDDIGFVEYPAEFNFRQREVECGPFSVAATYRALTGSDVDSFELYDDVGYKIPGVGVHPWGIEKQLRDLGLIISPYEVDELSSIDRINFLKKYINEGKPVIILTEMYGYQHYVTVFGFDLDHFYLYDSLQERADDLLTIDSNGDAPGNVALTYDELLEIWGNGGLLGVYSWYGIVVSS